MILSNDNVFLTIGIPTWNRCKFLEKNLSRLVSEVAKIKTHRIEIFVSDNASDDGTKEICEQFSTAYTFFRYFRQTSNEGANINFDNVLRMSQGQYVWLFGDDDVIVDSVIEKIINDIKVFGYPDLIIGPSVFDDTGGKTNLKNILVPTLSDGTIFNN